MTKKKMHYCPSNSLQTPCGRHWIGIRSTPVPDCRSINCKPCKKHILKARKRKYLG